MSATVRLGLTGGIGSGKSTVAGLLSDLGAVVVDADAISRNATGPNGSAIQGIVAAFGPSILTSDGALDRDAMRHLIYSNQGAKHTLEAIVHPLVAREIDRQAKAAQSAHAACIVFDIPLLVESRRWRSVLTRVLVIDCSEGTQVQRVVQRSGLNQVEIKKIIAAQAPRDHRLAAADLVLFNEGISLDQLDQQVRQIGAQFGL